MSDFEKFDRFDCAAHVNWTLIDEFVPASDLRHLLLFVIVLVLLDLVVCDDFARDCQLHCQRNRIAISNLEVEDSG